MYVLRKKARASAGARLRHGAKTRAGGDGEGTRLDVTSERTGLPGDHSWPKWRDRHRGEKGEKGLKGVRRAGSGAVHVVAVAPTKVPRPAPAPASAPTTAPRTMRKTTPIVFGTPPFLAPFGGMGVSTCHRV